MQRSLFHQARYINLHMKSLGHDRGPPLKQNPLTSNAFAVFSTLLGLVRIHVAYQVTYVLWYNLATFGEVLSLWYLLSESCLFCNVEWNWQLAESLGISVITYVWMFWQKDAYLENKCIVGGSELGRCGSGYSTK
jgi:hypothetical protein